MIQPPSSGPPIRSFVETVTLPDEITSVAGEIVTNPPCSLLKNPNQCDPMWYDVGPTYKLVYKPNYSYKMLSVYIYISINHGDNQEFLKNAPSRHVFFRDFLRTMGICAASNSNSLMCSGGSSISSMGRLIEPAPWRNNPGISRRFNPGRFREVDF